jgi:hypothetical protein
MVNFKFVILDHTVLYLRGFLRVLLVAYSAFPLGEKELIKFCLPLNKKEVGKMCSRKCLGKNAGCYNILGFRIYKMN